jgi:hypothetical protein
MGTNTKLNFGGAHSGNGVGHHRNAPHVPCGASISPKGWQRERVHRLARIFRCIERGRARGKRLHKMLNRFAWIWKARNYKCDPARAIHFRKSTLLRLYYTWRDAGRTPEALALHYWRGNRKASRSQVVKLSKLCLAPETMSLSAAYRTLKSPNATHWAYRKAMPPRLKAALAALLAHRRRGQALERAARRILEELT